MMNTLKSILLVSLMMISLNLTAQYESIYAVVSGDTVTLWETGAYRNCGSVYRMEIIREDNQINWYQLDTGMSALCNCIFDVSVTYGPLLPGNYNVNVYFTDAFFPLDTIFEGTANFTIGSAIREVNSGIISQYQSDCYSGQGLDDRENNDSPYLKIYPVPARNGDKIHFEAYPVNGPSVLEIYTVTGKLVYSRQFEGNPQIRDEWMKEELFPVSGLYLVRLKTQDRVLTRKITVF